MASILVLACGAPSDGDPVEASPATVRIAMPGDYPPFSRWPEGAPGPEGFDPELLAAWADASGRRIEWVRFRWPELVRQARAGSFDLAAGGITVRPDRAWVGTFGIPLATSGAVALVDGRSARTLEALDRPGRRIAVNRGGHLERVTRARFRRADVFPTTPNEAVPERLASGEVDAAITDTREAPVWLRDQPQWILLGPFTRDRKAVFAAPGHEALLAELDAWLLDEQGGEILDALRERHFGDDPVASHVSPLDALLAAMDERLSLMPYVARYKRAHDLPIDVPERERSVLEAAWRQVAQTAAEGDLPAPPERLVLAFFRAQIEAAKQIQRRVAAEPAAHEADEIPDLDAQLRPALIRIGNRIARLILALPSSEAAGRGIHARARSTFEDDGLSDETIKALADALEALMHRSEVGPDPEQADHSRRVDDEPRVGGQRRVDG